MKFKIGDGVIILTEYGYLGHGFPQDSYGEIIQYGGRDRKGTVYYEVTVPGIEYTQVIPEDELEFCSKPSKYVEESVMSKNLSEGEIKAKAVRYVYVVSDEDGAFMSTDDRDHARKVKKEFGGKKHGVKITAYAPVKEIR